MKDPSDTDQERSRRIESLLAEYRAGHLTQHDRAELEVLIDADYQDAIANADRLISANKGRAGMSTIRKGSQSSVSMKKRGKRPRR